MKILNTPLDCLPYKALSQPGILPLWTEGNLDLLNLPLASVVGSRDVSPRGASATQHIVQILLDHGICVVSGLAKGVDTIAHQYALDYVGRTIAVIGTPINLCYPRENEELQNTIKRKGLLISQFMPGTAIQQSNFPQRNFTMAEISTMTIVAEASEKSGTRHQVRHALALGKKVGFPHRLSTVPWIAAILGDENVFVFQRRSELEQKIQEAFSL